MITVTEEMKQAGADILWRELGFQCTPDQFDGEAVAASIFEAMLALASRGEGQRRIVTPSTPPPYMDDPVKYVSYP